MALLSIILGLALIGFLVWVILLIPMPQVFRTVIIAVVAVFLVLWVLQQIGLAPAFPALTVHRVR